MAIKPPEVEVYGCQTLYRELGYYLARREEYDRALPPFNEAISKSPNDKRTLMGRSYVRAKNCEYEGALQDINKALKNDPNDLVLLAHKALNIYLSCEFEDALVFNYRLVPKRKKPDNFTMGVMHCNNAIENCLAERAGHPLRDHYKIIRILAWRKNRQLEQGFQCVKKQRKKKAERQKTKEPVSPIKRNLYTEISDENYSNRIREIVATAPPCPRLSTSAVQLKMGESIQDSLNTPKTESDYVPPGKPFPFRPLQRYTTNIENYMAEKYLDSMYKDKAFFKYLKNHPGVKSPNYEGQKKILALCKSGYEKLAYKQELLRTRRPFYYIKYQEGKLTGKLRDRVLAQLRKIQKEANRNGLKLLIRVRNHVRSRETREALDMAEKLKEFCESKIKEVLTTRDALIFEMCKMISKAYYDIYRIRKTDFVWDQNRRIAFLLSIPISAAPSTDSVIKQFKDVVVDWQKTIMVLEERVRKAITSEEAAWLYNELSRAHTETKEYGLAKAYARKCMVEARACDNAQWVVSAMMQLVRLNILQHNKNEAKNQLRDVVEVARKIGDEELADYCEKASVLIGGMGHAEDTGLKELDQREKQIIQMMEASGMKDEVAYLFKRMSAMPASRRMSVMPGVKLEDAEPQPVSARKMSIRPAAQDDVDQAIASAGAKPAGTGKRGTEETKRAGIGFMDLIQYHVD